MNEIKQTLNIGQIVTFHEITYISGRDSTEQMFRICCTGEQARSLADELEQSGWLIKSIAMTASMDLRSAIEHVARVGENKLASGALQ